MFSIHFTYLGKMCCLGVTWTRHSVALVVPFFALEIEWYHT